MKPDYTVVFNGSELDLLYELARQARNQLPDTDLIPEPGSRANQIALLDLKLTDLFHQRHQAIY